MDDARNIRPHCLKNDLKCEFRLKQSINKLVNTEYCLTKDKWEKNVCEAIAKDLMDGESDIGYSMITLLQYK